MNENSPCRRYSNVIILLSKDIQSISPLPKYQTSTVWKWVWGIVHSANFNANCTLPVQSFLLMMRYLCIVHSTHYVASMYKVLYIRATPLIKWKVCHCDPCMIVEWRMFSDCVTLAQCYHGGFVYITNYAPPPLKKKLLQNKRILRFARAVSVSFVRVVIWKNFLQTLAQTALCWSIACIWHNICVVWDCGCLLLSFWDFQNLLY